LGKENDDDDVYLKDYNGRVSQNVILHKENTQSGGLIMS
jgi:hypothetical protein